ncbi:MAG: leucine--tRNA ligase [Calditrichaeota bacterium]|nr:MAG: leucine--tRNA ligase [Calditrichota bacterium]
MGYPFKSIEKKWRKKWEESGIYKTDLSNTEKKCYTLVMFCYPSGDKLHLGHWFNYGPTDTWARFRRLQGYNVFSPQGFDAFGLPAENYAIKIGGHPHDITEENIRVIREQLKCIGAMYNWENEVITSHPEYYKWTQWVFLQLYNAGLAYRAKAPVNWCSSCNTVLANEQVLSDGTCERCSTPVIRKTMTQWFFRITEYADRLINNLEKLDWPERTKTMQINWIGRSEGVEIDFPLADDSGKSVRVFTTRPDTLFGVTYMVLAPEHPLVEEITTPTQKPAVENYIQETLRKSELERTSTVLEKTGVFTGAFATNPVNGEKVPIWIADYVLLTYGTGAVMAVPGHDERDYEFAITFELPIRKVIQEPGTSPEDELKGAYTGEGVMINSGEFSGLPTEKGRAKITDWLEKKGIGKRQVNYKLRDWLISRQRYWGAPIPIVYCDSCGEVPVPEDQLPVELPYDVNFLPSGESPLRFHEGFLNTTCPQCGGSARREVDTMDTFVDSSWYFLRYLSPHLDSAPFDKELVNKWCPVDMYVGGIEHATMHLIYARFINMVLYDQGHINFEEPFMALRHQGVIKGPDGQKMSKSRGNVVNPEQYLDKYGSDAFRCHLMFSFEYAKGGPWNDGGIIAVERYLNRVWRLFEQCNWVFEKGNDNQVMGDDEKSLLRVLHTSIKYASRDTERFHFNTAISRLMELTNECYRYVGERPAEEINAEVLKDTLEKHIILLAPFAPHLAEELWEKTGHEFSVFNQRWPEFDPSLLEQDMVHYVIQINGKIREKMDVPRDISQEEIIERAKKAGRIPDLLNGKQVVKTIVVPEKLVNIVVRN